MNIAGLTALIGTRAIAANARNTASRLPLLKTFSSGRSPYCLTRLIREESAAFARFGRTDKGRGVFIVFTVRRKSAELLIRPISARYMHKKEIDADEKENPGL
jgi:hypothetical protein